MGLPPDIRCLPFHVLAVAGSSYCAVERGGAVAAVHIDGFAVGFPQGVQHMLYQGTEVLLGCRWRSGVDALAGSGVAPRQFSDSEVLHCLR